MRDLKINLDDTTFDALAELGRSVIPAYAPGWTDHNIHDPGIMLIELMAWVAEAQIYSLSRMRRDERTAYAGLMGLHPGGPRPAHGLVWPREPVPTTPRPDTPVPIRRETEIIPDYPEAPVFHAAREFRLTSATLTDVRSEFADGKVQNWTKINREDGASFFPFGTAPKPGNRLVLAFKGPLSSNPPSAGTTDADLPISIGIELAGDEPVPAATRETPATTHGTIRLSATLEDSGGKRPAELVEDTTQGLSRSGILLLRVPEPMDPPWNLVIQSTTGAFLLPPHVQRIAPNVVPVLQLAKAFEEVGEFATGRPDQSYELQNPDVLHAAGRADLKVMISESRGWNEWKPVADLSKAGPGSHVFLFDPIERRLRFGNGINGAIPEAGATLQIEYPVSAGARGNLPRSIVWRIAGTSGAFGTNSKPTAGGMGGRDVTALRAIARADRLQQRPYVNSDDLKQAALACSDLLVKRAREIVTATIDRRYPRGTRVLLVVGPHDTGEPQQESTDWLEEIRRRLAPHLPLGQQLLVIAPRYVDVRITARLTAAPKADPVLVRAAAIKALRAETALVADVPGGKQWPFGRDLAPRSVAGWLRNVQGMARVADVRLFAGGKESDRAPIVLGPTGLPRLTVDPADISVERWPAGGDR